MGRIEDKIRTRQARRRRIRGRMHGTAEHVGKVPASAGEEAQRQGRLARLRRDLKRAVDQEDFEQAAALRDHIRQEEEGRGS